MTTEDRPVRALVDERWGPPVDERHPDHPDERYQPAPAPTRPDSTTRERSKAA